ncbi:MAG: radical SAM protein [Thermodesulfobacteriota bacterium]
MPIKSDLVPDGFDYQGLIIRPPSEADSILLQVTLGCSHNKCTFCGSYKDKRFAFKPEETILRDLAFARQYCHRQHRVFLMDGDALVMPFRKLAWILDRIRENLPWVRRVGIYGNHKSVKLKTDEELGLLREKGLGIVYYGVESGDAETLARIRKGAGPEELIRQGRRLIEAGLSLSVTVLLGIAGRERSLEHATATGGLLTRLDPHFVGALTVMVVPGTALVEEQSTGRWTLPSAREILIELKEMISATRLSRGLFFSNHASNYLPLKIRYPDGRSEALKLIEAALAGRVGLRPDWVRAL